MLFTGEYEHTIDSKQRLAIPSEVRSRLKPQIHGKGFYLAPGANGALWVWPEKTFERLASEIEHSLLPPSEQVDFEELIFPRSRWIELDKAGRIRIPESMLSEFSLGNTVMILGVKDHLEIHDPEKWRVRRAETLANPGRVMQQARRAISQKPVGGKQDCP